MQIIPTKIKARWATAADPDNPKLRYLQDSKGEGVWPLEKVPECFHAEKFDSINGFLEGFIYKQYECCGDDNV